MIDVPATLEDKLWTLLEASVDVTTAFKVGNRVNQSSTDHPLRERTRRLPNDFPTIVVENGGGDFGQRAPMTFGVNAGLGVVAPVPVVNVASPFRHRMTLRMRFSKPESDHHNDVVKKVRTAILAGGGKLGLLWVGRYQFTDAKPRREKPPSSAGGVITAIDITLEVFGRVFP